jgi:hypothetical protein
MVEVMSEAHVDSEGAQHAWREIALDDYERHMEDPKVGQLQQENCELLDLFAADPDAASRWMETETPGKEFSPRAVREQLGQKGPEETYGHLSEIGTHPRLAGMPVSRRDPRER